MSSPRAIGLKAARTQDRLCNKAEVLKRAEDRLFNCEDQNVFLSPPKRLYRTAAVAFAAIVLLSVLAGAWLLNTRRLKAPLNVKVNGSPIEVSLPQWVPLETAGQTTVSFSDGSELLLASETRARLIGISDRGAEIVVEKGRVTAGIAELKDANWIFYAGPYAIRVTGTRFRLDWDNRDDHLSVEMDKGSVEIDGPKMVRRHTVVAGEIFNAWTDKEHTSISLGPIAKDARPKKTSIEQAPSSTLNASLKKSPIVETPSPKESEDAATRAQPMVIVKKSKRRTIGISARDCPDPDAKAALFRADGQRRLGDFTHAMKSFLDVRRCFAGSDESALAAFNLGKMAFDHRRDWQNAVHWFDIYLAETRGIGPVREALGRLIEALTHAGLKRRARAAAERYLATYPGGPHASYAHSILEEDTNSTTQP